MRQLRVEGHAHNGRATHVTLRFDERGNLKNPKAAAKNGMVGWGEWQQSEKVPSHFGECWWVSTAGHGGYILVTPIKDLPFKEPALKVEHSFGTIYVYEFEEDCDWAILEQRDELVRRHALKKCNAWRAEKGEPARSEEQYLAEVVLPCIQRWNPSFLEKETDVLVDRQGSIVGFTPMTDAARQWIEEHCQTEGWQWLGQTLNVEVRFAGDLAEGMQADGLIIKG